MKRNILKLCVHKWNNSANKTTIGISNITSSDFYASNLMSAVLNVSFSLLSCPSLMKTKMMG